MAKRMRMRIVPADPSLPKGTRYDEAEFLVGGRGTGPGETEKLYFRLHEGYVAELQKILEERRFPYETLSDLIRHSVVRHIDWIASLESEVEDSLLHQLRHIGEIVAHEEYQLRFAKSIDAIGAMVLGILELPGGREQVGRKLRAIQRHIDRSRDGFYKTYFMKMFRDRFGAYLSVGLVLLETSGVDDEQDDREIMGMSDFPVQHIQTDPDDPETDFGEGEEYDDDRRDETPFGEQEPED